MNTFEPRWTATPDDRIEVLMMGGTWAPYGHPVTDEFARSLDPARFSVRMIPYPADYGGAVSYAKSAAIGRRALREAIAAAIGPVVLAGYSQGAAIAGDVAAELAVGRADRILACALIADPLRPAGHCIDDDPGGCGIVGRRPDNGIRTFWSAAPGDPITALPAGNPLRSIADLTGYFAMSTPEQWVDWGNDMLRIALQRKLQRWWSPQNWRSWGGAIAFARGYLVDGRHTDDYVRHGHAARLAAVVNREVR